MKGFQEASIYENFLNSLSTSTLLFEKKIEDESIPDSRIKIISDAILYNSFMCLNLTYSAQLGITKVNDEFDRFFKRFVKLFNSGKSTSGISQYSFEKHLQMLSLLSIAVLLEKDQVVFEKIAEILDRDQIKDELFEYILTSKLSNRQLTSSTSYGQHTGIPDMFKETIAITKIDNKEKCTQSIAKYLQKGWYESHKNLSWYNIHNRNSKLFFGYWAFEIAAIVKLKGIDNTLFENNIYFPNQMFK